MSTLGQDRPALVAALTNALRDASGLSVLFSQAVADRVGMNPTDLESLDVLIRHGPMTAGRLAQLTGLTTGAITGLIDRLERHGYARREADPSDRRRVIVRPLTEDALRDLDPIYAPMQRATDELLTRYSDAELATILDFLHQAAATSSAVIARTSARGAGSAPVIAANGDDRTRRRAVRPVAPGQQG